MEVESAKESVTKKGARRVATLIVGLVCLLGGAVLLVGGTRLVMLGGSLYYAIDGALLVVIGVLYLCRFALGAWLFLLLYLATWIWALSEVGLDFWGLVPRIVAPTVLGIFIAATSPWLERRASPSIALRLGGPIAAGVLTVGVLAMLALMFVPHGVIEPSNAHSEDAVPQTQSFEEGWTDYGHDPEGTRFSPLTQITPDNVDQLQVAWVYHTGDKAIGGKAAEDTPLQIGSTLYSCTPSNKVYALDVDTGEEKWHYDPEAKAPRWLRCRGLSYYEPAKQTRAIASDQCPARIIVSTIDARLIELNAENGELCEDFGDHGVVDLHRQIGKDDGEFYAPTSAPILAGSHILIGGHVYDNQSDHEPSGVLRAFDARTGRLQWAWDAGRVYQGEAARQAEFRLSSPNVWSTPAYDPELGLAYIPTGNPSPDFWGGNRTQADETYGSSVVALDVDTGEERWHFQTTHHDLWDYDIPSQPTLYDMPDGHGGRVPALFMPTKRGQIFVLDRRTGDPLADVTEKPAPQGPVPEGDTLSPTQPYSTGFPAISSGPLSGASMWGATPFDQLYCRIRFQEARYEGDFTPPGTSEAIEYPGHFGGFNWGSASIDATNDMLIINDIRLAQVTRLIPREEAGDISPDAQGENGMAPQNGTPFASQISELMSPLGIPCLRPPWGTLTGINLRTRQIAWQVPLGTAEDRGPMDMATHLPIPIGMPSVGGSAVTASHLAFYAGTQDFYLRAFDTRTGKELWKSRLPVGSSATPMTYRSPETGKQYVVISASGSRDSDVRGDYLIAYALPDQT